MGLDLTSFLIGKQSSGGGGGGGGQEDLAVWKVGFFGSAQGETTNSITVNINGWSGKYALISVMHRSELTAPEGCVLLDKQTLHDYSYYQYISIFKYAIQSDSVSLAFNLAASGRNNATVWAVESDFQIGACDVVPWADYFKTTLSIETERQSFLVFNAYTSQTARPNVNLSAESDGVWINQQHLGFIPPSTYSNTSQVRHYTGMISSAQKASTLSWWFSDGGSVSTVAKAEVYVYAISKA